MMKAALIALLFGAVLLAACGGDDDDDSLATATPDDRPQAVETGTPGTSATPAGDVTAPATGPAEHCPDPGSLEEPGDGATDEVVAALAEFLGKPLAVSDVIAGPATDSPYFEVVAADCGQQVLELSWFVRVCTVPCAEETSASLPIDYFLAKSDGQWQVYFEY